MLQIIQPNATLICLTGGIATGKSRVSDWLTEQGWTTICSDEIVHQLYEPNQTLPQEIAKEFGPEVVTAEGRVNREVLGKMVFGNEPARERLNRIVHPKVRAEWRKRSDESLKKRQKTMVVIPLAFETEATTEFNSVWVVACSSSEQKRRLHERGLTDSEIQNRLSSQWPIQKKIDLADCVIWNNDAWALTVEQLEMITKIKP
jgi:dephospho-CoA kinase